MQKIYHGYSDQIHFDNGEKIADEQLLDRESGEDEPKVIKDESIDTDISEDKRESDNDDVAIPRKQKVFQV